MGFRRPVPAVVVAVGIVEHKHCCENKLDDGKKKTLNTIFWFLKSFFLLHLRVT